ncbi:MAG: enoyl-CoA hydratase/isomerase family protein [Candidatus Marinimicrobia bacterium]|nr:enoyl-CoA hydratase/isomerase family protein [Candidatus Neomarinimicrobiota bacterium]
MNYKSISLEIDSPAATIRLNSPPYNVIDIPMMEEIFGALQVLEEDNNIQFVLFRGAGDKLFSAGVDIADHTEDKIEMMLTKFHDIFRLIYKWDKISISVVHAPAIGGGCELAALCDFVIAAESATFSQPEINVGCYPPAAAAAFPRIIGPKAAMDMILTGRELSAKEAKKLGLVTRVVPDDNLNEAVDELIATLKGKSRAVLSLARKSIKAGIEWEYNLALTKAEDIYFDELMKTEDVKEGVSAFLEKRKPDWRHK